MKTLHYYNASIPTIISFLKHIYTQHKEDRKIVSNNFHKYAQPKKLPKLFTDRQSALEPFSLPEYLPLFLKEYFIRALKAKSQITEFDSFIKEHTGFNFQDFSKFPDEDTNIDVKDFT